MIAKVAAAAGLALAARGLWTHDSQRTEAIVAVLRGRPVLYRVRVAPQAPVIAVEGAGARLIDVRVVGAATGISIGQ